MQRASAEAISPSEDACLAVPRRYLGVPSTHQGTYSLVTPICWSNPQCSPAQTLHKHHDLPRFLGALVKGVVKMA